MRTYNTRVAWKSFDGPLEILANSSGWPKPTIYACLNSIFLLFYLINVSFNLLTESEPKPTLPSVSINKTTSKPEENDTIILSATFKSFHDDFESIKQDLTLLTKKNALEVHGIIMDALCKGLEIHGFMDMRVCKNRNLR